MEKLGPLGEKFIEAVHKKKAETEPDHKEKNPETAEEVIEDLKEMGIAKERQVEEELKQKPFTEEDAEDIINVALGEDVFKKPYVYQEIDRLGKELVKFSKKAKETKNMEAKKVYEEKARFFQAELEKAKTMRDKIKIDEEFRKVRERQRQKRK